MSVVMIPLYKGFGHTKLQNSILYMIFILYSPRHFYKFLLLLIFVTIIINDILWYNNHIRL